MSILLGVSSSKVVSKSFLLPSDPSCLVAVLVRPPDLFRVWPVSLVLGKTICSALQNQIAAQFSSFSRLSYVK